MSLLFGYSNEFKKMINANTLQSVAAMKKAGSAAYRARKAFEATQECTNKIKTATKKITVDRYGEPKTVGVFQKGIVLLGIVTKTLKPVADCVINYDFHDVTGNKHIAVIHGKDFKIITDDVSSVQDVHTNLKPCSISIVVMGKDVKLNKPQTPIELEIIIQYIELQ